MAKRTKTAGANLPVPQNREEAEEFIRTIGAHQRAVARVKLDLAETVAGLKEESDKAREPYETAIERLTEGLKMWCEANRAAITDNNRVKHADFLAGKVLWRIRSPKVTHPGVEAEEIVGRIKAMGKKFIGFLRVVEEIDKDAMLADKEMARTIPGVKIGSEGETFAVEPFELEPAGA